jgi:hypothetical protein
MGNRFAPRSVCVALCALLPPLLSDPSRAAEWSIEPSLDLGAVYNDNISLTSAPHPSVWGWQLWPAVVFTGATENLSVNGGLRLGLIRYYGEQGLNHNDYYFTSRSSYKTERDVLGLNLAVISDPTLVTELATTGVVLAYRQRTQLTASPSWTRYLTETTFLTATYSYSGVNYADTPGTGLIDYRDQTATVGLQRIFDEANLGTVTAYYDRFETNPSAVVANTYGIQAGFDHRFSETLRGTFVAGVRQTQNTNTTQTLVCDGPILFGICLGNLSTVTSVTEQTSTGWTLNVGLEKRWETASLAGRLSREIYPTGVGSLVQTDRLQIGWTNQWSPTITTSVNASTYQSEYIGGTVTNSNSRYYRIDPKLDWRISEQLLLSARYSFSRAENESNSTSANANAVYLTLSYVWPKISYSR